MQRPNLKTGLRRLAGLVLFLTLLAGCGGPDVPISHSVVLKSEYSEARSDEIDSFAAYMAMEEELFEELEERVRKLDESREKERTLQDQLETLGRQTLVTEFCTQIATRVREPSLGPRCSFGAEGGSWGVGGCDDRFP